jgi:hypothetical protein
MHAGCVRVLPNVVVSAQLRICGTAVGNVKIKLYKTATVFIFCMGMKLGSSHLSCQNVTFYK